MYVFINMCAVWYFYWYSPALMLLKINVNTLKYSKSRRYVLIIAPLLHINVFLDTFLPLFILEYFRG